MEGWSTEEMKTKSREDREKDSEKNVEWRSMSQEEMDECWKRLAEKMEEEVLDKYKVEDSKREAYRGRFSFFGIVACTKKQEVQDTKVERRLLGKNLRLVQRVQPGASARHV